MTKIKATALITIVIILIFLFWGLVKKQSYTNIVDENNYAIGMKVAEITDDIATEECLKMEKLLPDSPIILCVQATEDAEHLFYLDRQRVKIQGIYSGDTLNEGDEIYIFSNRWMMAVDTNPSSFERGFVNFMKVGENYLIFGDQIIKINSDDISSVRIDDDYCISAIFCYEDRSNNIVETTGNSTYVNYEEVADNEFFASSEKALTMLENLKKAMLEIFPLKTD